MSKFEGPFHRYFVSSFDFQATEMLIYIHKHWEVENIPHRV